MGNNNRNIREGHFRNGTTSLQFGSDRTLSPCDSGVYTCRANQSETRRIEEKTFKLTIDSEYSWIKQGGGASAPIKQGGGASSQWREASAPIKQGEGLQPPEVVLRKWLCSPKVHFRPPHAPHSTPGPATGILDLDLDCW